MRTRAQEERAGIRDDARAVHLNPRPRRVAGECHVVARCLNRGGGTGRRSGFGFGLRSRFVCRLWFGLRRALLLFRLSRNLRLCRSVESEGEQEEE